MFLRLQSYQKEMQCRTPHLEMKTIYNKNKPGHSPLQVNGRAIIGVNNPKDYFLPSSCSFKAARASMSPNVVEAA